MKCQVCAYSQFFIFHAAISSIIDTVLVNRFKRKITSKLSPK